jgi:hypothetical protein
MGKDDRLNVRMNRSLKEWFRTYAQAQGGMSAVLERYVLRLKYKANSNRDAEIDGRDIKE